MLNQSINQSINHKLSVIVITIGRESLLRAIRSIFNQNYHKPIQIMIGVDLDITQKIEDYQRILHKECPPHITLTWINLGYSTSVRHGGVHSCFYGGSLRSALTLLANSKFVSYLDDDDWFLPNHVSTMMNLFENIPEISWAHPLCYYADGNTEEVFCLDEIESVGVNQGIYREKFGGFVRPSGLTLNKLKNLAHIHLWSEAISSNGDGEDRLLFERLKSQPHATANFGTVCYALDPKDAAHSFRLKFIREKTGKEVFLSDKIGSSR